MGHTNQAHTPSIPPTDPAAPGAAPLLAHNDELAAVVADLQRRALYDGLTGLPNRSLFDDRLDQALARLARARDCLAVLFVDIDGLKAVNDSLGHDAGDEMLFAAARRLVAAVRETDTVARIGGDEFLVVACGLSGVNEATHVAQRLEDAFERPLHAGGEDLPVSASIGVATTSDAATPAHELVRMADVAMYRAKANGGGCWVRFDDRMAREVGARLKVEGELRVAPGRDELSVHYQPIVRLEDATVVGCEALVRWNHPRRGLLSPDAFIPLAEDNGLVVPIGTWVLDEACRQAAAWRQRGIDMSISVNVSPRQLNQPDFVDIVRQTLSQRGLPAPSLCLEITETAMVRRLERLAPRLERLKRLGVRLAMDDFGRGFSSLSHLRGLPIDVIKIDGSFVDSVSVVGPDRAIIAAIVSLGHEMGLTVIAEHIERDDQLAALRRLGCPLGQGYLFAPPNPPEALDLDGFDARGRPGFGDPYVIREFMRQIGIPARMGP
ncbi:MAG: putative bifunctional diguanylate cyclase/phosphodiesterase [Solirubrobacteraceae bacterium]